MILRGQKYKILLADRSFGVGWDSGFFVLRRSLLSGTHQRNRGETLATNEKPVTANSKIIKPHIFVKIRQVHSIKL